MMAMVAIVALAHRRERSVAEGESEQRYMTSGDGQ